MDKKTFVAFYIATFLASYAATNHDMNNFADKKAVEYVQPVEVAAELAGEAWKKLQEFMTK